MAGPPNLKKKEPRMEIAKCRLWLNKHSDIAADRVTPAEVLVIREIFKKAVGKDPVTDLVVLGTVDRSDQLEVKRLLGKYTAKNKKSERIVSVLFPGNDPRLPETFEGVWPERAEAPAEKKNDTTPSFNEPIVPLEVAATA